MPLVWAHAEYVKLCRSLGDGRVFDTPPQPVQRYQVQKRGVAARDLALQPQVPVSSPGQALRLEVLAARPRPLERRQLATYD